MKSFGQLGTNNGSNNNGSNTDLIEFVKKCCSITPYCISYDDASGERVYETALLLVVTDKETNTPLHQGFYVSNGTSLVAFQQPTNAANVEYTAGSCGDSESISILNDIDALLEVVADILNTLGITLENINENINDVNANLTAQIDILNNLSNELSNQTPQLVDINAELDAQTELLKKCCASKTACVTLADGSTIQVIVGYIFDKETASLTLAGIFQVQANGTITPYSLPNDASLAVGSCAELTAANTKVVQIQACDNTYDTSGTLTNSKPIVIVQLLNVETGQPINATTYEITAAGIIQYQPQGTVEFGDCCKSCPTLLNIEQNCIVFLDECDENNYDIVIDLDNKTLSVSVVNNAFPLPAINWQGTPNVTIADPTAANTTFTVEPFSTALGTVNLVAINLNVAGNCDFVYEFEYDCTPFTLEVSVCGPTIFTENFSGTNGTVNTPPDPNGQILQITTEGVAGEWYIYAGFDAVPVASVIVTDGLLVATENSLIINQAFINANPAYNLGDAFFAIAYQTPCGVIFLRRKIITLDLYNSEVGEPANTSNTTNGDALITPNIPANLTVTSWNWTLQNTLTTTATLNGTGTPQPILLQGYGQGGLTIETQECGIQTVPFTIEQTCADTPIVAHLVEQSISTSLALESARSIADKTKRQVCLMVVATDSLPLPTQNLPNPASLILGQSIQTVGGTKQTINPALHPLDPAYSAYITTQALNFEVCVGWPEVRLSTNNTTYPPLQDGGSFVEVKIDATDFIAPSPIVWNASADPAGTQFQNDLLAFLQNLAGVGSYFANDAVAIYLSNNRLHFAIRVWAGDGMSVVGANNGLANAKYKVSNSTGIITMQTETDITGLTAQRKLTTACGTIDAELLLNVSASIYNVFATATEADVLAAFVTASFNIENDNFCVLPASLIVSLPSGDPMTSIVWQLSNGLTDTNGQTQILNTETVETIGSGDYEVTVQTAAGCEYTTNGTV